MKNYASFASVRGLFAIVVMIVMSINTVSCSSADDDQDMLSGATDKCNITDATVTYTYTVPEELLRYVDVQVCVNNDDDTDMLPLSHMRSSVYSHTYKVSNLNMETVFVALFQHPLASAHNVHVDWTIMMDITISMKVDGAITKKCYHVDYEMEGDLWQELYKLNKNPLDRTFAVTIGRTGECKFRR